MRKNKWQKNYACIINCFGFILLLSADYLNNVFLF